MVKLSVIAKKKSDEQNDIVGTTTKNDDAQFDHYVVMASISPPEGKTRTPTEVCCVVDISGSMDSRADCQDENGNVESSGLSLLDVTKHALKTVIASLDENDKFALVSYSDAGRRELALTRMDKQGKKDANAVVEGLRTEGCTNLFDGLITGLDTFVDSNSKANRSVLILTDGQPNREPSGGHIPGLRDYLDTHPNLCVSINTFGFGYNLQSGLLKDIAQEGSGTYTFVPDAGFVGTGFVNCLGNICSTSTVNAILSFQTESGCTIKPLSEVLTFTPTSWGATVNIGTIQHGQSKDTLALATVPTGSNLSDFLDVHLKCESTTTGELSEKSVAIPSEPFDLNELPELYYQTARMKFVDMIKDVMEKMDTDPNLDEAGMVVKQFLAAREEDLSHECFSAPESKSIAAKILDIMKDASGQVHEAVSRTDWYNKWGRHYLPSLSQAHLTQRCNNFKDPGVQHYGGEVFGEIRDYADDQFNKLPPPKPSLKTPGSTYRSLNMAAYNNMHGGCVAGDARVLMADGSVIKASEITQGHVVACAGGKSATVKCVVKTNSGISGQMPLVKLKNLTITPWHPVRESLNGHWCFPADLAPIITQECSAVYTYLLDSEHEMLIDGYHYASLGHGKKDAVVRHSFWGNMTAVVDSLSVCKGWKMGFVEFLPNNVLRKNGIVVGFDAQAECFNEKKTENSKLREQIKFWTSVMQENDYTPLKIAVKSASAKAKIKRNTQRPRVTRRNHSTNKYNKSALRDLQDQISLGKEEVIMSA